jgi:hypothetical protein
MAATPQHTYQILTKRPERLRAVLTDQGCGCPDPHEPGRHFRSDVAAEATRLGGGAALEHTGAWPLPNVWLGTSIESDGYARRAAVLRQVPAALRFLSLEPLLGPLPSLELTGIDWVIVGGESGPGHRPLDLDWVRDIRDRCVRLGIPLFFKQVGGRTQGWWAAAGRADLGPVPHTRGADPDRRGAERPGHHHRSRRGGRFVMRLLVGSSGTGGSAVVFGQQLLQVGLLGRAATGFGTPDGSLVLRQPYASRIA